MFRIRAIQVEHGDSLLVSYGDATRLRHLLVDGGPSHSRATLLEVLELECVDGKLRLEALVVTHYDLDHIQGVIELLDDLPTWLEIGDVWFNGYHHLQSADMLGPSEGDTLSKLIRRLGLPWNARFRKGNDSGEGGPIHQSLERFALDGDLDVGIVSPDADGLVALAREWKNPTFPPFDPSDIPGDQLGKKDTWPPGSLQATQLKFEPDPSIPNRSSIALLLTFDGKRVLLAADASASVLKAGLAKHLPDGASVDLLKVSHHGSKANTDIPLLQMLKCPRFLISTSGKIHKHPDHALIARLVADYGNPQIFFNYGEGWPGNWKNKPASWPRFRTHFPEFGTRFVDVTL